MKIILNGKEETLTGRDTLASLISLKKLNPDTIIIEYNGCPVEKVEWAGIVLKDNDSIEILWFVGGG